MRCESKTRTQRLQQRSQLQQLSRLQQRSQIQQLSPQSRAMLCWQSLYQRRLGRQPRTMSMNHAIPKPLAISQRRPRLSQPICTPRRQSNQRKRMSTSSWPLRPTDRGQRLSRSLPPQLHICHHWYCQPSCRHQRTRSQALRRKQAYTCIHQPHSQPQIPPLRASPQWQARPQLRATHQQRSRPLLRPRP